jgi:hypothetical protein
MMVVPVLITSCQVSEKLNMGPRTAHMIMIRKADINAIGEPVKRVIIFENRSNNINILFFIP